MHSGKKKMPLQIAMSETIHNICKSKKLIQVMNKLGLSMSYEEMERVDYALTHRIIKQARSGRVPVSTSICSLNIIHGAMDNFDHEEDTISGIKWSHDTVMIIFQNNVKTEIEKRCISVLPTNDVVSKNRRSAINLLKCQTLLPSGTFARKGNIATDYQCKEDTFTNTTTTSSQKDFIQWTLCRSTIASHNVKSIPSYNATKSLLSTQVKSITQHACTPIIPYPATEHGTINTCMKNFQDVLIQKILNMDRYGVTKEYIGLQKKFNF